MFFLLSILSQHTNSNKILPIDTLLYWTNKQTLQYVSYEKKKFKLRAVDDENILEPSSAGTDAILDTIRVARQTNNNANNNQDNQINNDQSTSATAEQQVKDQQAQAAENSSSAVDELTFENLDDDENRGKRFVSMIDRMDFRRV